MSNEDIAILFLGIAILVDIGLHIYGIIVNKKTFKKMSKQLDTLTADVAQETTVVKSAVTLIGNLKTELDAAIAAQANGDDGAALAALSTTLEGSATDLAAAIAANTPAAPSAF